MVNDVGVCWCGKAAPYLCEGGSYGGECTNRVCAEHPFCNECYDVPDEGGVDNLCVFCGGLAEPEEECEWGVAAETGLWVIRQNVARCTVCRAKQPKSPREADRMVENLVTNLEAKSNEV